MKKKKSQNTKEKEDASERFSLATTSLSESGRGSAFAFLGAIMTLNFSGVLCNNQWGKWLSLISLVCLVVYFVIDLIQYILQLHASKKQIDKFRCTKTIKLDSDKENEDKENEDKEKWRVFYKSYRMLVAKIVILFLVILMFFTLVIASI